MIYIINNNTAYGYSKFICRPKWLINLNIRINLFQTDSPLTNFLDILTQTNEFNLKYDKDKYNVRPNNTFQSAELLCWRSDLQFLNLRAYFSNMLKALHLCWLAARNNKRIVFIDHDITMNHLRSQLVYQSLFKQHKRQIIPRQLESFLIKARNNDATLGINQNTNLEQLMHSKQQSIVKIDSDIKLFKNQQTNSHCSGNFISFNELFGLLHFSTSTNTKYSDIKPTDIIQKQKTQFNLPMLYFAAFAKNIKKNDFITKQTNENKKRIITLTKNLNEKKSKIDPKQTKSIFQNAKNTINSTVVNETAKPFCDSKNNSIDTENSHNDKNKNVYFKSFDFLNKNPKYQIKLRAKAAQLASRQSGFFVNASGSSFLSNSKNAFKNQNNLLHLDHFIQNPLNPINNCEIFKHQIVSHALMTLKLNTFATLKNKNVHKFNKLENKHTAYHNPELISTKANKQTDTEQVLNQKQLGALNKKKNKRRKTSKRRTISLVQALEQAQSKIKEITTQARSNSKSSAINQKRNKPAHLLRLRTKPLKLHSALFDGTNIKNSALPFFNGAGFASISDLVQHLLKPNRGTKRNIHFLENFQNHVFSQFQAKQRDFKTFNMHYKFLNRFYIANTSNIASMFYKKKGKTGGTLTKILRHSKTPFNLMLKSNNLQKYYRRNVNTNNYKQSLGFVKNPWLTQADIIFFVDPEKNLNTIEQAKRFNIPTIGIISGSSVGFGRHCFKNYSFDDCVNYPILGNSASIFFVRSILEIFIKTIQTATKTK
jgi:Ribosomal protein S2